MTRTGWAICATGMALADRTSGAETMSRKRARSGKLVAAAVRLICCEDFDARGMRRVYGRTDHYGRSAFNMDIWLKRDGRLLMRFWSKSSEVDGESYEIIGIEPTVIPVPQPGMPLAEEWVPEVVWKEFDRWVTSEMSFPSIASFLKSVPYQR